MDKKTFFLVLIGVLGVIGYLGWNEYQKSVEDERQFRLHLLQDEQRHQKELMEAQLKAAQEKRMAEEERQRNALAMQSAEDRQIADIILQKKADAIAQVKGLIESKGNGTIERHEADQIWARKITDVFLQHADSMCTYSYKTGLEGEMLIEITFNINQLGTVRPIVEKTSKTNYDFLEVNSKYEQKIFAYCEKGINKTNCDKKKEISTFKILLADRKTAEMLKKNIDILKKLYGNNFENLKKLYQANDL
ncbi:MAG: hypothetical protein EAZ08_01170 [Cytophagales bacterium]|nr:MAG: hypothetical protein EAZ08_01170 [Cytophagales bacterium]